MAHENASILPGLNKIPKVPSWQLCYDPVGVFVRILSLESSHCNGVNYPSPSFGISNTCWTFSGSMLEPFKSGSKGGFFWTITGGLLCFQEPVLMIGSSAWLWRRLFTAALLCHWIAWTSKAVRSCKQLLHWHSKSVSWSTSAMEGHSPPKLGPRWQRCCDCVSCYAT